MDAVKIASKLQEQYQFMPTYSKSSLTYLFGRDWYDSAKGIQEKERQCVSELMWFCCDRNIRFRIQSRFKTVNCLKEKTLEYQVFLERDFCEGCVAEVESDWLDSLFAAFLSAIASILVVS